MSFNRSIASLGFLALAFAASPARAQDCKADTDCKKGFYCELTIATPPPTEPAPTCAPGSKCPVSDPVPTTNIVAPGTVPAQMTGICREAPCTADTDCGAGMICHTDTIQACSGGSTGVAPACPPNADCLVAKPVPATDPVCTETKVSTCMYKWQLPCNADADCGAGFTCQPTVTGSCSGGSGTATPGSTGTASGGGTASGTGGSTGSTGAAAPTFVPPPDSCTTTSSFPGYCAPKATTCTVTADCPTDWTCEASATGRDATTTNTSGPATGAAAPSGTTAPGVAADVAVPPSGGGATLPAPVPTTMMCVAPLGVYGVARDASGTPQTTGTGGSTSGPGGTPAPMTPGATGNGGQTSNESAMPSAGCAVGGVTSGSSLAFALGLVGLALARRRRQ
jgi:MYXO-CTERM domain-containing protein